MLSEDEADLWNCLPENECGESTLSKWEVEAEIAWMEPKNIDNKKQKTIQNTQNTQTMFQRLNIA